MQMVYDRRRLDWRLFSNEGKGLRCRGRNVTIKGPVEMPLLLFRDLIILPGLLDFHFSKLRATSQ